MTTPTGGEGKKAIEIVKKRTKCSCFCAGSYPVQALTVKANVLEPGE
jgi:hypothetical protein